MADEQTVRDQVLKEISKASGTPRKDLRDDLKLKTDLVISHQNFVVLAQSLRYLIVSGNPSSTLLLREIETRSATVGSVAELVRKRIAA